MKRANYKILTLLFIATLFSSCAVDMFNRVNGNRNVVTEDRSTKEEFTKIKVSAGLELYISQGSKNQITVEADENFQEIIITEVNNGVLKISAISSATPSVIYGGKSSSSFMSRGLFFVYLIFIYFDIDVLLFDSFWS